MHKMGEELKRLKMQSKQADASPQLQQELASLRQANGDLTQRVEASAAELATAHAGWSVP